MRSWKTTQRGQMLSPWYGNMNDTSPHELAARMLWEQDEYYVCRLVNAVFMDFGYRNAFSSKTKEHRDVAKYQAHAHATRQTVKSHVVHCRIWARDA